MCTDATIARISRYKHEPSWGLKVCTLGERRFSVSLFCKTEKNKYVGVKTTAPTILSPTFSKEPGLFRIQFVELFSLRFIKVKF